MVFCNSMSIRFVGRDLPSENDEHPKVCRLQMKRSSRLSITCAPNFGNSNSLCICVLCISLYLYYIAIVYSIQSLKLLI